MTEIKRDSQGNVLCPICGGILYAEVKTDTYGIFQNGEREDWNNILDSITCLNCGASRQVTQYGTNGTPDFLSNRKTLDKYFDEILENFMKHSL
jgi:rubredoxin